MAAVCASAPASHLQRLNGTRRFGERRPPSRADSAPAGAGADVSGHPTLIMAKGQAVAPKATTLYQTCCTTINAPGRLRRPRQLHHASSDGSLGMMGGLPALSLDRRTHVRGCRRAGPRLGSGRRRATSCVAWVPRPGRGVARGFATRLRPPSGPCGSVARV